MIGDFKSPASTISPHGHKIEMPMVGFEPTTYALQVRCSTTELHRQRPHYNSITGAYVKYPLASCA